MCEKSEVAGGVFGTSLAKVVEELGFGRNVTNHNSGATDALPSEVKLAQAYVENLGKCFLNTSLSPDQQEAPAGMAFNAIANLLRRLQHVSDCKVLDFMLCHPDVSLDTSKVFGSHRARAIGNAISTWREIDSEIKALRDQEHDWAFFASKLSLFESLSIAVKDPVMKDKMFEELHGPCRLFVDTFLEVTQKAFQQLGPSYLDDLTQFESKYGKMVECAETWQMEPVMHLLEQADDTLLCVGSELDTFTSSAENVEVLCESLKSFTSHGTTNDKLLALQEDVRKFHQNAQGMIKTGKKTAATSVMASLMVATAEYTPDAKHVQEGLKLCHERFGTTKDILPQKLQKLVNDLIADGKSKGSKKRQQNEKNGDEDKEDKPASKRSRPSKEAQGDKGDKDEKIEKPKKPAKKAKK